MENIWTGHTEVHSTSGWGLKLTGASSGCHVYHSKTCQWYDDCWKNEKLSC